MRGERIRAVRVTSGDYFREMSAARVYSVQCECMRVEIVHGSVGGLADYSETMLWTSRRV